MTTNELLNDAADYIETYGWVQHQSGKAGGPACAISSLHFCCNNWSDADLAVEKLYRHLGNMDQGYSYISISSWNDNSLRTKEEVIAALRAAAECP
jgi:hypothetical protein